MVEVNVRDSPKALRACVDLRPKDNHMGVVEEGAERDDSAVG